MSLCGTQRGMRELMRRRRGGAVARVASMAFPAEMRPRGRHLREHVIVTPEPPRRAAGAAYV